MRVSLPVYNAEHSRYDADSEDVISVGDYFDLSAHGSHQLIPDSELTETNAGHKDSPDMIPTEGCLVDFSEGESSALVRVRYVSIVVVEVVEGSVAASSLCGHRNEVRFD